jgi:hypothetical protein
MICDNDNDDNNDNNEKSMKIRELLCLSPVSCNKRKFYKIINKLTRHIVLVGVET